MYRRADMSKITNTENLTIMNNKDWYIVDAKKAVLGRLASKVASMLRGKHKPSYLPYTDNGDYIIAVSYTHLTLRTILLV